MTIQKELVSPACGQSFTYFSPRISRKFFWHFHPEPELVFVEASSGIRHVGRHVSSYQQSDLVLIGPNIPHLNFDYGLKTEYRQFVVQMKEDFLGNALEHTPELSGIRDLFSRASRGLAFYGPTKVRVGDLLKGMEGQSYFRQLILLLESLQVLADSAESELLNDEDASFQGSIKDKERMSLVYDYIQGHFDLKPDVHIAASLVHLSTEAFCRYFRRQTGMTFTDFVNRYRIGQAKTMLLQGKNIAETGYSIGFESGSYFNKVFRTFTGESPSRFKKRYLLREPGPARILAP